MLMESPLIEYVMDIATFAHKLVLYGQEILN